MYNKVSRLYSLLKRIEGEREGLEQNTVNSLVSWTFKHFKHTKASFKQGNAHAYVRAHNLVTLTLMGRDQVTLSWEEPVRSL
jgi:hypothetical protein